MTHKIITLISNDIINNTAGRKTAEDLVKIFLKISCQNSLGIMLEKVGWIF